MNRSIAPIKPLEIQEVAIALAIQKVNPEIVTPDFLRYSGMITEAWDFARPPVVTPSTTQLVFQIGINLLVQSNRVIFSEAIATKDPEQVAIPTMIATFSERLPELGYQGVGINLRGHLQFDQMEHTRQYVNTLLAPAPWQMVGNTPLQASLRLMYSLDDAQFSLEIQTAGLRLEEPPSIAPIVLFNGNFSRVLSGDNGEDRRANLTQIVSHWQHDLSTYQDIINTKFVAATLTAAAP